MGSFETVHLGHMMINTMIFFQEAPFFFTGLSLDAAGRYAADAKDHDVDISTRGGRDERLPTGLRS